MSDDLKPKARLKPPLIHPFLCTKLLSAHSDCKQCLSVCPTDAIQFADRTLKISSNCTGCELCISVCPNEVFSSSNSHRQRLNLQNQIDPLYCSRLLPTEIDGSKTLPFSFIPCSGSIPVHYIIKWFLERERPLEVVTGRCSDCPMKNGAAYFEEREKEILAVFRYLKLALPPVVIRMANEKDIQNARQLFRAFRKDQDEANALSRRDFFLNVRNRVAFTQKNEGKVAGQKKACRTDAPQGTEHLRSLVQLFKKYKESGPSGEVIPGFVEIKIDKTCTGCGVCANFCPTGALRLKKYESDAELTWSPTLCTQCKLCVAVCTKNAVNFMPCSDSEAIINETRSVVKHFYRHTCPECRREYISNRLEASCNQCLKDAKTMDDVSKMIYGQALQKD